MATTYWATGICRRANLLCKDPRQIREMAQENGIDMDGEERTFEVVWAMELLNPPLRPDNLKQEELGIGLINSNLCADTSIERTNARPKEREALGSNGVLLPAPQKRYGRPLFEQRVILSLRRSFTRWLL